MTSLYQDIKAKLTRLHVLEQFIVINSFVFIVVGIMSFLITNGRFHVFEFLSLSFATSNTSLLIEIIEFR